MQRCKHGNNLLNVCQESEEVYSQNDKIFILKAFIAQLYDVKVRYDVPHSSKL